MLAAASPSRAATRAWTLVSPTTESRKPGRLKPYGVQTNATSTMEAATNSTALTICTQVVAFMPPNTT